MMRMWEPSGAVNLDAGYVVVDGRQYEAAVVDAPRLPADFTLRGETFRLTLRSSLGIHELTARMAATTVATAGPRLGMAFGADTASGQTVFAPGFAEWEWDGDVAYGLTERSDRFG
jgi:hypothetical protein